MECAQTQHKGLSHLPPVRCSLVQTAGGKREIQRQDSSCQRRQKWRSIKVAVKDKDSGASQHQAWNFYFLKMPTLSAGKQQGWMNLALLHSFQSSLKTSTELGRNVKTCVADSSVPASWAASKLVEGHPSNHFNGMNRNVLLSWTTLSFMSLRPDTVKTFKALLFTSHSSSVCLCFYE